jgi:hypothetical protein
MANQTIWILETSNPVENDTDVTLYEDKTEAYAAGVAAAVSYMEDMGADNPNKTDPEWYEQYQDILAAQTCNNYVHCLKLYDEWICNMGAYEDVYNVCVYSSEVIPKGSSPNWNPSPNPRNQPIETTCVVVPEINNQVKANVSCRFCQTSLEPGESPCWKCGTKEPTNLIGVIKT